MKFRVLYLFGFILCVSACRQADTTSDSLPAFRLYHKEIQTPKSWSDLVSSSFIVSLETKNDGLIGRINKIQADDSIMVILDKTNQSRVMLFGMDGQFIQQLSKAGKGPGEYVYPVDFNIVKKRKEIWLIDGPSNKLMKYSYSGEYLSSLRLSFNTRLFSVLEDGGLVCESGSDSLLVITDPTGQPKYAAIRRNPDTHSGLERPFDHFQELVRYHVHQDNSIYIVDDMNCKLEWLLDFSPKIELKEITHLIHFSECQGNIELHFYREGNPIQKRYIGIFDKNTNQIVTFDITHTKPGIAEFGFRITGEKYGEYRIGYGQSLVKEENGLNPQIIFYRYASFPSAN